MKTLHISVSNKVAEYRERDGFIVCGNSNYQIEFAFDSEWDEHEEKTARFVWNKQYFDQEFTGNVCPCPIIKNATEVSVGVYAGNLETTTGANIPCRPSILCDETIPHPESGQNYSNEAKQAAEEAQAAAEEAKEYADGLASTEVRISKVEKRVTNLEKGITPDPFVTDDTVAYQKAVPAGALPYTEFERVGGMSYKSNNEGIRHAAVTEMESIGTNLWDEVTEIGGITSANGLNQDSQIGVLRSKNYIRISPNNPLFVGIYSTGQVFVFFYDSHKIYIGSSGVWLGSGTIQPPENAYYVRFQLNSAYGTTYKNDVILAHSSKAVDYVPFVKNTLPIPEAIQALEGYGIGISADVHNYIDFENTEYVQMCSDRAYQSGDEDDPEVITDGTKTVYPLGTPIVTKLPVVDNFIKVEGGGTITFVNEHKMSVPSVLTYLIKEVTA